MKLIHDKKVVKLRRASRGVIRILEDALCEARDRGYDRVIIIGESKDGRVGWSYSRMRVAHAVGMLEIAKKSMLE